MDAHDRVTMQNVRKDSRNLLINKRECRVLCERYTPDKDPQMVEDSIIFIKRGDLPEYHCIGFYILFYSSFFRISRIWVSISSESGVTR